MSAVAPRTVEEAVALLAARPELTVVAGGTDVMVGVNDGRHQVDGWLSLRRIPDLREITDHGDTLDIGAATTFDDVLRQLAHRTPGLARAARTVGSPQIRSAGTIGGNVVTASPAADAVPMLLCHDAEVELVAAGGARRVDLAEFATGPKRTVLAPGELLRSVRLTSLGGVESFAKVGTRNAMVIAVCSLAARLDVERDIARVAVGSAAPTVVRAREAEAHLLDPRGADTFADVVVASAAPIDDVRATAAYRRHALHVLARRAHAWLWSATSGRAA